MEYKRLFIFVEGPDDERFITGIIAPLFRKKYDSVEVREYAETSPKKTINFFRSILAMKADYIYLRDINDSPCAQFKKHSILKRYAGNIAVDRLVIVIKEIESWYLSGLGETAGDSLGVNLPGSTDDLVKEDFNNLIPGKFASRNDFMVEILKHFSIEKGVVRNRSFKHFIQKHNLSGA